MYRPPGRGSPVAKRSPKPQNQKESRIEGKGSPHNPQNKPRIDSPPAQKRKTATLQVKSQVN